VSFSRFDHECMATALRLARKGMFTCDPNPRVGCVIADGERILGRGWHERAGGPHAEVGALEEAGDGCRGQTAYVTLEPCAHDGRTPPCTEALIAAGIGRVVIACGDPNPAVDGEGVARLRSAGIKVEAGLMAEQAESLNPGFLKRMRTGLPWLRVKSAVSFDGRTALANGESKWISGEHSRQDVQNWRARSSAILTGIATVLADDPTMNARVDQPARQPLRVIADSRWRTPPQARMLAEPSTVLVAGSEALTVPDSLAASGADCRGLPAPAGRIDLRSLLEMLGGLGMNEVQVEAGPALCGALLQDDLVDELLIYQAPVLLGEGARGPFAFGPLESMQDRQHLEILEVMQVGDDLRIRIKPHRP
jgi:diaminohydroxyphosphoribosylaminopyrimidine deaminase/5-amino-6-(5-phosphoribosylamino)uracil reductase